MKNADMPREAVAQEVSDTTLYINPNLNGLDVSRTLAINEKCKQLISEGKAIYRFGLGQSPFPIPDPVVNALRLYATQKEYVDVKGLYALREAVAEFHRKKDLVGFSPENIIIGPGSKELLFLLQLVFNGDILISSPSWVSYVPQATILGKKIRTVHTSFKDNWNITPDKLEEACRASGSKMRLLILNYPGNPDGMTYGEEQLKALSEVARRNNLLILSDEIYGQIHHEGNHVSMARYYPEGTIISSGLSKWCGAGGWRLGTFSFPESLSWLAKAMTIVASETYTSVSAPIQYAAVHAFSGGAAIEDYLWHVRRILAQTGRQCALILRNAGVKVHIPQGAFYLFPDFSNFTEFFKSKNILSSNELCERLLDETGAAILPGDAFNRPQNEFSARMAYVDFDGAKALSASQTIPLHELLPEDFSLKWCAKAVLGTQKIAEWLAR